MNKKGLQMASVVIEGSTRRIINKFLQYAKTSSAFMNCVTIYTRTPNFMNSENGCEASVSIKYNGRALKREYARSIDQFAFHEGGEDEDEDEGRGRSMRRDRGRGKRSYNRRRLKSRTTTTWGWEIIRVLCCCFICIYAGLCTPPSRKNRWGSEKVRKMRSRRARRRPRRSRARARSGRGDLSCCAWVGITVVVCCVLLLMFGFLWKILVN